MWKQIDLQEFVDLKHGEHLKPCISGEMHGGGLFAEWSPDGRPETALIRYEYNPQTGNQHFRFEGR
jgi:hypothetical protein